ncbi:hypothetical protein M2323_000920 [Rhodoblastus acidophilus]|uniref:hypothetical protein n=1 Tax=Rhodoblastus acidophilus TaxID=1074 RepID=UPI002225774C|nr:hypothetical protein [Rhodoblastus acidophilus]MCW2283150.1 hypothetical protein [Rhodoblastus acidophilus]MCW2332011.1 hypothetical protein [Rhodoblastus acidophilus]
MEDQCNNSLVLGQLRRIVAASVRAFPREIEAGSIAQEFLVPLDEAESQLAICASRGWLERRHTGKFRATQAGAKAAGVYWWHHEIGATD